MIWFGLNEGHNDETFWKQFGLVEMTYCPWCPYVSLSLILVERKVAQFYQHNIDRTVRKIGGARVLVPGHQNSGAPPFFSGFS